LRARERAPSPRAWPSFAADLLEPPAAAMNPALTIAAQALRVVAESDLAA
jgi:hypothetical protein